MCCVGCDVCVVFAVFVFCICDVMCVVSVCVVCCV